MSEEQKKKTQTARLKLRKKAKQAEEEAASTDAAPPSETKVGTPRPRSTGITDPLSLRETNLDKLKRVRPEEQSGPLTLRDTNLEGMKRTGGEAGETTMSPAPGPGKRVSGATDTVRLKVVRNKKRELSKVLTASQTIHLRPPAPGKPVSGKPVAGEETGGGTTVSLKPPAGAAPAKPASVPTATAGKTLKIRPTDVPTEAPAAPLEAKPSKTATATLKIRKRKAAGATGTPQVAPAIEAISEEKKFTAPLDVRRQRADAAETQEATKAAPPLAAKPGAPALTARAAAPGDVEEPEKTIKATPPAGAKPSTEPLTVPKKAPAEAEAAEAAEAATAQISKPAAPAAPQKRKTSPLQLKKKAEEKPAEEDEPEKTQIAAPPPPTGKKIQTAPIEKAEAEPEAADESAEAVPEADGESDETLKLGSPKLSLKISSKGAPAAEAESAESAESAEGAEEPGTTQPPSLTPVDTSTAKLTLKVKQPPGGGATTVGKTITLPGLGPQAGGDEAAETQATPVPDAAATQKQAGLPDASATVALDGEPAETAAETKGGLKLKSKKKTGEPPAVEAVKEIVGDAEPAAKTAGDEPGLMLTLASFTTAAALVALTFFVTYQFLMLCR